MATSRAAALLWLAPLFAALGCGQPRASRPPPAGQPAEPSKPARDPCVPAEPIQPVRARFPMPAPARPVFPYAHFDIRAYGAVEGGTVKNTEAIRRAVRAAATRGGGTVLVPEGRWLTGPIRLESNVNLHISAGAVLRFSQDFADYLPPVFTRWEGLELYNFSPLIYAQDCRNVAVTGAGTLDGQGAAWWPWKATQKDAARRLYELASRGVPVEQRVFGELGGLRPSFIQTVSCKNVLIEGVTLTNGPMWTIHPVYSENVIVRRVRVLTEGPNNDGCNPDSSRNVLIEDSFFSTGDDCVVIKSGLNEDGWRVGRPSENIVVRRIRGERGHGGVVIGSEMSGGVRNVQVQDCEFVGTDRGLRIKSMRGRGGVVENVHYENVRHHDLRLMDVELTTLYGSSTLLPLTRTPPVIRGIHVRDLHGRGAGTAVEIVGLPEQPIENVLLERVDLSAGRGVRCSDCRGLRVTDARIRVAAGPELRLENVQSATIERTCTGSNCVELAGTSQGVSVDGRELSAATAIPAPAGSPAP